MLASCYGASAADRQLLGDAPGQQTRKLAHAVREVAKRNEALAEVGGVNVHAGAAVPSRDRQRLERLCRYVARPPLAQERLELTADGRCRYNFRHAWKNGVHAVLLAPLDLIARLCALIPPPRFHMLRYHGVLAAHAKARPEVVPGPEPKRAEPTQIPLSLAGDPTALEGLAKQPSRHPWAWLLSRVFAVDIMTCPRCRGAMRLVKIANRPDDIARALADLGLGARPPPRQRPAPAGQLEFDFAA
ncbi:transposase [Enhygromyxa salina]|uniref:Putative transposase n=1 Tax=Enhygromyxa salina TaxID=215803 RepID=A0A2S9YTD9_9BACT|nr:transposase [Enhygromyxa salina]PRQ08354.1 putative transposase [Enhygromyxa salina]